MIGILLALQINNWNNDRIEHNLETNILREIAVNLERDVANLRSKIEFNESKTVLNQKVLNYLMDKTPLTDSLRREYNELLGRGTFEPITVAYENLKSKGIDIIHNDSLRIMISELYDFKYFYIAEDLRTDYEPIKNFHMTEVYKNVKTSFKDGHVWGEPVDLESAQDNIYFHEALKKALEFYYWMDLNYEKGIVQNEEVQSLIKAELAQRAN
jgi:hypothetical protein